MTATEPLHQLLCEKYHVLTTQFPYYVSIHLFIYLFIGPKLFFPPQLRHSHPSFNSPLSSFGPWEVSDIMHTNNRHGGMCAHVFFYKKGGGRREEEAVEANTSNAMQSQTK